MTMRLRRAYPSSNDNVQFSGSTESLCPAPFALKPGNTDGFLRLHKRRCSSAESKAVMVLGTYLLVIVHPFTIFELELIERCS